MIKLLIITVSIGLAAVCGTVIVGAILSEGTVEKDPYTTALRWDSSRQERMRSGWSLSLASKSIKPPTAEVIVTVFDGRGEALTDAVIDLSLTLPATDRYDSECRMANIQPGIYRCVVNVPVRGRWLARLNVRKGGTSIRFDEAMTVD